MAREVEQPSTRPAVKTGQPWSETDDAELRLMAKRGMALSEIARVLERTVDEVRERLAELSKPYHEDP